MEQSLCKLRHLRVFFQSELSSATTEAATTKHSTKLQLLNEAIDELEGIESVRQLAKESLFAYRTPNN